MGLDRDLIAISGAPREWSFEGVRYLVHRLRVRDHARLAAWLAQQVPHPLDAARRHVEGLPVDLARHVWDRALEAAAAWPPSLDSPEGRRLINSPEGQATALHAILARSVPGLTIEDAGALAGRMGDDDWDRLRAAIAEGTPGDPKAGGATAPTTASPSPGAS